MPVMKPLTYPGHSGHAALRKSRRNLPGHVYRLTIATRARNPVFSDFQAACAAARAFTTPAFLGDATLLAWVLMPDHTHWLLQLGGRGSLERAVSRLKSASARHVNQATGCQGAVWGRAFHDHAMRDDEDLLATARYIIANPLRAGLVERIGDYPFWNTTWL